MAMPWSRSKQIAAALRGSGEFPDGYTGSRTIAELNALFDAQFRIQREACEAAGRYIPMVVENVRGAQPWVGRAKANFGSYYLWGDVGMVGKRVVAGVPRFGVSVQPMGKAQKVPGWRLQPGAGCFQDAAARYHEAQKRNPDGTEHGLGSWFKPGISFDGASGQTSPGFNVTAAQRYREAQEPKPKKRKKAKR